MAQTNPRDGAVNRAPKGNMKLRVTATSDDFIITVGICKQGGIQIRNLKVVRGGGWATLPVQRNSYERDY
jgi:hypothetical protein